METFQAGYGGTGMMEPVKETLNVATKDMALQVFLVTDGEIWNQQELVQSINEEVRVKKEPVRLFMLGIGSGTHTHLVEGVVRVSNGFCRMVGDKERLYNKVVRML